MRTEIFHALNISSTGVFPFHSAYNTQFFLLSIPSHSKTIILLFLLLLAGFLCIHARMNESENYDN